MNSILCSTMHRQKLSTRKTVTLRQYWWQRHIKGASMNFHDSELWLKCQWNALLLTVVSRNEAARCKQQIKINLKRFPDQFLVRLRLLNDGFVFCLLSGSAHKTESEQNSTQGQTPIDFMNEILLGQTWLMKLTTFLLRYKGFTRFTIRKH